ncbi:Ribosomal RNA small subunit methyltransferase, mitochondrial [Linum perenne]
MIKYINVLQVICQDALKAEFPPFDLVVANIPYGISSPLIIKLVYGKNPFRSATLLLQKEFARRLLANPGDSEFNRLAVNDFLPCPKVDSSVVMIHPKLDVPEVNLDEWYAFTRTCFGKKNKTLGATFKQKKKVVELLKLSNQRDSISEETDDCDSEDGTNESSRLGEELGVLKEKIVGVLRNGGFEDKRPSKLKNEELLELLSLLNQAGVYFHDYENGGGSSSNVALADADYD